MAIDDLASQLKALSKQGEPDLQLSQRARDDYLRVLSTYRSALVAQRDKVASVTNLGNAGAYHSAQETTSRLELNAAGLDGIYESLDKYIAYLNTFEDTVNAAFKRIQAHDRT